ncbi:hypothetical protein P43SY_003415 [Pythium insidiosum]|uniref:HTH myb-type domain-containing protein n=1 Tax=Pythium insidiosum TaxID=114742 RepID=A0AAD5QBF2_PYTIN|nr:hypothetical protein P43SY_003415 [Pythium insidiosum]
MTLHGTSTEGTGQWTAAEHDRFLQALKVYPKGPWRRVAEFVGTRNVRQTMTHAQKYRQKLERHQRGLRSRRQATCVASPAKKAASKRQRTDSSPRDLALPDAVGIPKLSFMDLIKADYNEIMRLEPIAISPPTEELDIDVLPTPVVSECLDFLIQSFA